jgi:hypothetical protein
MAEAMVDHATAHDLVLIHIPEGRGTGWYALVRIILSQTALPVLVIVKNPDQAKGELGKENPRIMILGQKESKDTRTLIGAVNYLLTPVKEA